MKNKHIRTMNLFGKIGIAVVLLVILVVIAGRFRQQSMSKISIFDGSYTVIFDGLKMEGEYKGDSLADKPNGKGTFTAKNKEFVYEGEWANGFFSGNGKITYADGRLESGSFKDGKRSGLFEIQTEQKIVDILYDDNVPYGPEKTYVKGKLKKVRYNVNGEHTKDIKKQAKVLDKKMIKKKSYINQYVSITGEVCFLGDDDDFCYFRIKSESLGMIIGSYPNTENMGARQRIIPNMKSGDQVTLYGFFTGMSKCDVSTDNYAYQYDYPFFEAVYGELDNMEIPSITQLDYKSISRYPYCFTGEVVDLKMRVKRVIKNGDDFYVLAYPVQEDSREIFPTIEQVGETNSAPVAQTNTTERAVPETTVQPPGGTVSIVEPTPLVPVPEVEETDMEENEDYIYVLHYKGGISDTLLTGSEINIKGRMDGLYKLIETSDRKKNISYYNKVREKKPDVSIETFDYKKYPYIEVDEIE